MIGIVDYGAGNLFSVGKALDFLGADFRILSTPGRVGEVDRLILPGVGAFGAAAERLEESGWMEALRDWARRGRPLLGICLGMQLFFDSSVESEGAAGLGLFPGVCRRLTARKVPQIGWNRLFVRRPHALLAGVSEEAHFYFVHGFRVEPKHPGVVLAETRYDEAYASVVGKGSVTGVQFHPEKSGPDGLRLLSNWRERC